MHSFPNRGYVGKTVRLKWAKVLCASPSVQETSEVISLLMNTQTAYSTYTHCAVEDWIIVGFLLCVTFGMHALCQCNMTSHIQHCIVICTEPFHSGLVTDTNAQSYVRLCLAQRLRHRVAQPVPSWEEKEATLPWMKRYRIFLHNKAGRTSEHRLEVKGWGSFALEFSDYPFSLMKCIRNWTKLITTTTKKSLNWP